MKERGDRYGSFDSVGRTFTTILDALQKGDTWEKMSNGQKYCATHIATKLARAVNGDPLYDDNWIDIQGYARLGEKECGEASAEPAETSVND